MIRAVGSPADTGSPGVHLFCTYSFLLTASAG